MPQIRGAIFNIAVDVRDMCSSLLRESRSSGIILVKFKKDYHFVPKDFGCPYLLEK